MQQYIRWYQSFELEHIFCQQTLVDLSRSPTPPPSDTSPDLWGSRETSSSNSRNNLIFSCPELINKATYGSNNEDSPLGGGAMLTATDGDWALQSRHSLYFSVGWSALSTLRGNWYGTFLKAVGGCSSCAIQFDKDAS